MSKRTKRRSGRGQDLSQPKPQTSPAKEASGNVVPPNHGAEIPNNTKASSKFDFGSLVSWRILQWLLSALGLLSLIDSLSLVKLYGQLAQWMETYRNMIRFISEQLFGWANWRWIGLSEFEANYLIIALTPISAFCYAQARFRLIEKRDLGTDSKPAQFIGVGIATLLAIMNTTIVYVLIPCLLLPPYWGVALSAIGMYYFVSGTLSSDTGERVAKLRGLAKPREYVHPKHVKRELVGVFGILLILLAANSFFKFGS